MNLALFFTEGVSLQTWHAVGMLGRELALYAELSKHGIQVQFVTYGSRKDLELADKLNGIEVACNQWNLPEGLYRWSVQTFPPRGDVFKSNQVAGSDIALAAAQKRKAKFVARCGYLLSEFQASKYGPNSGAALEAARLEQRVFDQADRVVVTTPFMAEIVRNRYGIVAEKITVIPNYVETDRFRPMGTLPGKRFRIGFVGRLDQQKNLFALIDAMIGLDAELALVGYGPQKDALAAKAAANKVEAIFMGNIPNNELPALLNTCQLFVLPSLYEGHPKALIEAMACGLPVIGTNVVGIRELVTDGANGLLCEPDASSLRIALQRSMEDSELRGRLGSAARQYVKQHFSLARVVDLELSVLNELAG